MTRLLLEAIPLWLAQTKAWIVSPSGSDGEYLLVDVPPDRAVQSATISCAARSAAPTYPVAPSGP